MRLSLCLSLVMSATGACASPRDVAPVAEADALLIIPGKQIGPLVLPATEADVMRVFGHNAKATHIDGPEGGSEKGTILFDGDRSRQAFIRYDGLHPGPRLVSQITIEDGAPSCPAKQVRPPADQPGCTPNAWHMDNGLRAGMYIKTVQRLNGRPFDVQGAEGDGVGGIGQGRGDWHQGRLSLNSCGYDIIFEGGAANREDAGVIYSSDDPNQAEASILRLEISATPASNEMEAMCNRYFIQFRKQLVRQREQAHEPGKPL